MEKGGEQRPAVKIQERAFQFACRVVKLHQFLVKQGPSAKTLAGQLLRSGTSLGANLQEAQSGQSKADFISKCNIALKEAREAHFWLRLLQECEPVSKSRIASLTAEANEIVAILVSIVKKAKENIVP